MKNMRINKERKNKNSSIVFLFLILVLAIQSSCSQKIITMTISPDRSVEECKKLVLEKGDKIAYYDLKYALHREKCDSEYLFYSLFMVQKYNYVDAYYWVYKCIVSFYEENNITIDKQTLDVALHFLGKGVELNNKNAQIELGWLYLKGKYVIQDTIKGKELWIKGWDGE
jgi:hypothetical protein